MKTYLLTAALAFCGLLGTLSAYSQSVQLHTADDSLGFYCPAPAKVGFQMFGTSTGYSAGDSIYFIVHFGDGNSATIRQDATIGQYWINILHTYTAKGVYTVRYIMLGSNGSADTIINIADIVVGDSCGSISGNIYHDDNANCTKDGSDLGLHSQTVELWQGNTVVGYTKTQSNGDYFFAPPFGFTYEVRLGNWAQHYNLICPSSPKITIANMPSAGNDFAVQCKAGTEVEPFAWGTRFRPGQSGRVHINLRNFRCAPAAGEVKLVLPSHVTLTQSTPAPTSQNGNVLKWNFTGLTMHSWHSITVGLMLDTTLKTGDTLCFEVCAIPNPMDSDTTNNVKTYCWPVRASWDPNDKNSGTPKAASINGGNIDYTVRFQNTGTDTAFNIFILDTIQPGLNLGSLRVIGYSHPMKVAFIGTDVVKFSFDNILLPDSNTNVAASQGYVQFALDYDSGLAPGTKLHNTAAIYFDYNAPVITNTTEHEVMMISSIGVVGTELAANLFPNPANSHVSIRLEEASAFTYRLMDLNGRVLQSASATGLGAELSVSELPNGTYLIEVRTDQARSMNRLVIAR